MKIVLAVFNGEDVCTEIDDADFETVSAYQWRLLRQKRGHQYAQAKLTVDGKRHTVMLHRLLLGATGRNVIVDHKDGNGLNNRRSNLRLCSHAENMRNRKVHSNSKSGIKGVSYMKMMDGRFAWCGCVKVNGKKHRAYFETAAEADAWCVAKRAELHGKFAYDASRCG